MDPVVRQEDRGLHDRRVLIFNVGVPARAVRFRRGNERCSSRAFYPLQNLSLFHPLTQEIK